MRNNLKISVISVIELLTLTVISAMTINSLSVVKAEPYGQKVSREAQKDDAKKGFGEEVSPLAKTTLDRNSDKQVSTLGAETTHMDRVAKITETTTN